MTSPLVNLREFLARQHLAGIIVPRTDEFQNEYIAPANEALAWLCGFTGSNGLAVVLKDKAALFTDGRYSLQAKEEVNGEQFSLHHIIQESPALWLAQQIKQGDKIAYIPALHTPDEIEKFAQSVRLKGGSLAALTEDPLTALWQGRPARLASPVRAQDKAYAGLSSSEKIVQILPELKNQQLDAMLLTAPDSVCWLLNIRGEDVPYNPFVLGAALLYQDGNVDLFVDPARIKIDLGSKVKAHKPEDLPKILAKLKDRNLGFDKQRSSVYFQQQAIAAGAKIIFVKDPCQLPKACKNPVELQGIHAAHQRDGAAVTKFL
ncbi:MAG: aminopeptidase P family N-terminal domain-containing protein, partial [Dongiaceae bacterium]